MGLNVNTVGGDHLVAGGQKRATPGWYHIHFTQVKETDKCDAIELHGIVLSGKPDDTTITDFIDSVFNVKLKYPDASKSEDAQTRANARLTAFMVAADLVTPLQLGQPVNVDEQLAVGRHALIHLQWSRKQEGDKWVDNPPWVDLAFNDLLHIDDPDGANVPKNVAALKFVPAACRHTDPKYFAFKAKPSTVSSAAATPTPSGNAAGAGSHATAGSTAPAGTVF